MNTQHCWVKELMSEGERSLVSGEYKTKDGRQSEKGKTDRSEDEQIGRVSLRNEAFPHPLQSL
jgi:hypothetical protein